MPAVRLEEVIAMLDAGHIDEARAAVAKLTGADEQTCPDPNRGSPDGTL